MLTQHEFYVYHAENVVYARWGKLAPVVAETLATPAAAFARVQKIVNPKKLSREYFDDVPLPVVISIPANATPEQAAAAAAKAFTGRGESPATNQLGFLHPEFQAAISPNCEAYVREAYEKAGLTPAPVDVSE